MTERERVIQRVRARLERRASPRLHMFALVSMTATVGLLASYLMLKAGVTSMEARYPIAVGVAYLAFLGLVGLWLRRFRLRARERHRGELDLDSIDVPIGNVLHSTPEPFEFGGGGGFVGGGGGTSWGEAVAEAPRVSLDVGDSTSGWSLDFDDGILLLVIALIATLALSVVVYVVWTAPALFAELLLDAGLAAGLYRRLARVERRRWLVTAIRGTILPACIVAMLLGVAGAVMQLAYPDAVSIGGVVRHLREPRPDRATH